MTENYVGIDYGMGISNRDPQNPELHYGVISQHTPSSYIWEDFERVYFCGCPECGTELEGYEVIEVTGICPSCGYEADSQDDWYGDEPIGQRWTGEDEYLVSYSESLFCFFVEKSPFYTFAKYCSPCAPGAGDLDNPAILGVKTYCLGEDFFDEYNKCPYMIYKLENDEFVYTPEEE